MVHRLLSCGGGGRIGAEALLDLLDAWVFVGVPDPNWNTHLYFRIESWMSDNLHLGLSLTILQTRVSCCFMYFDVANMEKYEATWCRCPRRRCYIPWDSGEVTSCACWPMGFFRCEMGETGGTAVSKFSSPPVKGGICFRD